MASSSTSTQIGSFLAGAASAAVAVWAYAKLSSAQSSSSCCGSSSSSSCCGSTSKTSCGSATCQCGCNDGKPCTCSTKKDKKTSCGSATCQCGCNDGKPCTCVGDEAKEEENVYERKEVVDMYLMMHYGKPDELLRWDFGPKDALEYPARCAKVCADLVAQQPPANGDNKRALDVGCAVGRSTFELARYFEEAVGVDFSHAFIDTANELKANGARAYEMQDEGDLRSKCVAEIDAAIDRQRCTFRQGDACDLDKDLGQFAVVLGANLLCRLPKPRAFLARLADLVVPGGFAVLPSPYSWMEEYTPKSEWLGGYTDADGNDVQSADGIAAALRGKFTLVKTDNMPFLIRETRRKNQYTVAHLTVWQRNED